MAANLSKAQIDRLGDRLREGPLTEADLRLLEEYRGTFSDAYQAVVRTIRDRFGLEPTGRQEKTPGSIIAKLQRLPTIKLSQMQDVAGCRVVVKDIVEQDRVVQLLCATFSGTHPVDRRVKPSHGYRAVHVIPKVGGKPVEIQVRTLLQDLWASLSERYADVLDDPAIKYGGGDDEFQRNQRLRSMLLAEIEKREANVLLNPGLHSGERRRELEKAKREIVEDLQGRILLLDIVRREKRRKRCSS